MRERSAVSEQRSGGWLRSGATYLISLIGDNKGAAILAYTAFVCFKVLAVSNWSLPTALAILSISSLPAIVVGATLSAVPMLALVLSPLSYTL